MQGKTPQQSTQDGTTGGPSNAFEPSFLSALARTGEVATAPEAEMTGPWRICRLPDDRYGLFREWEAPGDRATRSNGSSEDAPSETPEAVFRHRAHALLAAAVLPATGRERLFKVGSQRRSGGFVLESVWGDRWVTSIGRLRCFQPEIADALHVVESVVRSPVALAYLLEAAGSTALKLAGRLLRQRLQDEPMEGDET